MNDLKVVPLTGNISEAKKLNQQLIRELPEHIERYQVLMKYHRAKYDAAIAEGFSPVQALELCKTL